MGKSDKKVKSDRINALRKQYDAFLEEDKRRKERNDYILGRLDKMRFCTTIVPVRHKHNAVVDRKDIINPSLCQPVHTPSPSLSHHTLSVDVARKPSEDTFFLQEISKKYILIPKTRSGPDVNLQSTRSNYEDNTDWKSKYDILEQLKRDEKESEIPTYANKYDENNKVTTQRHDDNEIYDIPILTNKVNTPTVSYKYEVPERDKEADSSYELQRQDTIKLQNEEYKTHTTPETDYENNGKDIFVNAPQAIELNTNFTHSNNNKQIITTEVNDNTELQSNLECNVNTSNQPVYETDPNNENINESDYLTQVPSLNDSQYVPIEEKDRITETENVINVDENESKPIEVISTNDFVNEINTNDLVQENPDLQDNHEYPNHEYPETINIQDQDYIPGGDVVSQQDVNINSEAYLDQENYNATYQFDPNSQIIAENTDEPVDMTGIEAFETEQKEMFYSENVDQNYEYNEDGTVEGTYNQDLTAQNSYPQHEESVYYEGAETEQEYPVEIDEHAEATERYDPNYEQQFGAAYTEQYQQEGYEQLDYSQQPQYDPEIIDQAQQGIEQLQFVEQPYESAEHVQQQLDREQDFKVQNEQSNINEIQKPIETLQTDETAINLKS